MSYKLWVMLTPNKAARTSCIIEAKPVHHDEDEKKLSGSNGESSVEPDVNHDSSLYFRF